MSFVFCFEPVVGRRGSDARSKLDDISVSEGTQVHKKILAMFGAGSRNLLPLYLVYQFTMDEGLELFFCGTGTGIQFGHSGKKSEKNIRGMTGLVV